ncbi:hypothetical protein AD01_0306 [Escherichia coli 2-427-07_S4_C2]|nr:hypothetical protein CSC38_4920 [Escherichia coli]EKI45360.1 hypothetical protein EC07798_0355 [Escherichia coli 07798]KDY22660.1 hypothetical protein AD30_0324 [Escherichia coli 2-316-03_S4_C3]KDY48817.1 hypothetical protein AD01_0306 [Escherichia coli 2-427-07_S4_C2]KEJ41917.1 hypothetical protein AB65_0330 [Escherichia coli 2-460-02_S1_C3]KEJ62100.1 hypothetical protein AC85_0502 [Escherichia coli 3-020-07_S4_C1]KEO41571.1 hypothetical protein AB34_0342 [Escherichia coli 2-460-02_S1_C2]
MPMPDATLRVLSGLQFVQCFMTMPDISPVNNLIIFSPY